MKGTVRERLEARLVPDPDTGCLLWTGAIMSQGYGTITVNGRTQRVHRVAWELENGPIPPGMTIDHVYARGCRHKHCANVAHLEVVTTGENTRRAFEHYNRPGGPQVAECAHGHPRTEANVRLYKGKFRACRPCERKRDQRRRQKTPSLLAQCAGGATDP